MPKSTVGINMEKHIPLVLVETIFYPNGNI